MTIELRDEVAALLESQAAARGMSLGAWFEELAIGHISGRGTKSPQEVGARMLELQKHVGPDPDGWTVRDYIDHGRL